MSELKKGTDIRSEVRKHYGKAAREYQPKSSCGCGNSPDIDSKLIQKMYDVAEVRELPADVTGFSMGCGDPITLASLLPGQTVLDLGAGGGLDCFLAAKKVGEKGHIIGVDMTAEMLEKARTNQSKLGVTNVDFRLGEIEHLPVADASVDVIISNCVVNLSPDKEQVFREAFRVLRPGGKLSLSDIVTQGPLPKEVLESMDAWAGCLAGAIDINTYRATLEVAGFTDVQITPVPLDEETANELVKQLAPETVGKPGNRMIVSDGAGVKVIELGEGDGSPGKPIKQLAVSAKITAKKP